MPVLPADSSAASNSGNLSTYRAAILRKIRELGPRERDLLALLEEIHTRRDVLFAKLDETYRLQDQMREVVMVGAASRGGGHTDAASTPQLYAPVHSSMAGAPSDVPPQLPPSSSTSGHPSASVDLYDPEDDNGDEDEGSRSSTPTQANVSSIFLRLRRQDAHFEVVTGPRTGQLEVLTSDDDGQHDEYEYEYDDDDPTDDLAEEESEDTMSPYLEQATNPSIWDPDTSVNTASWGDPDDDNDAEDNEDVASIAVREIGIGDDGVA